MISANVAIATAVAYVIVLFALAYFSDQRARSGRGKFLRSPLIYTLAISVYCTSWTFYGAVGSAARNGLEYLAIYLGPTLVFTGWWFGLRKLVRIGRSQRITSIADLLSSRFGKSGRIAVLVTLIAVTATTPYIALQLKAITSSLQVITGASAVNGAATGAFDEVQLALIIAAAMAVFTILFGTRNVDANEQHHGVVAAIAFEAVVKFLALAAVGIFVVFGIGGGFSEVFSRAAEAGVTLEGSEMFSSRWVAINVLSAAAIICLPRQFQITVVENSDEQHLRTASWAFPLYLFGMSIFTMPIAIVGLSMLPAGANPDLFVLTLPLTFDQDALALFAFIGGFSSATSMIIIASIALSIMVSNHIVMPLALRTPSSFGLGDGKGVTTLLLNSRRAATVFILALGFIYFWATQESAALAAIGLIAFAGVAQFVPALIAALYWREANAKGALAGLVMGFALWGYTLFLPSFESSSPWVADIVANGAWGIALLKPQALLGMDGLDPLVHSVFWSLFANTFALVTISLATRQSALEQLQSALFVDAFRRPPGGESRFARSSAAINDLFFVAQRVLGYERAAALFDEFAAHTGVQRRALEPTPEFISILEKELAGSIGAASAHVMLSQVVSGDNISLEEVMQMADETQQAIEYSQQLEQTSDELRSTARKLQRANERLRELDQQKDEFLSQVSHEVRTPMTSIRSFSEILLDHQDLSNKERERFLTTIHTESLRLTSLLDEILDLNALERGEQKWINSPTSANAALERAIEVCTPLIRKREMELKLGPAPAEVHVNANPDRLCQVFINLISNAAKYNDADEPFIEVKRSADGQQFRVDIRDNGPGIPTSEQKRIFEKFSRGRRGSSSDQTGAGLGLAISREIISNMDGKLELVRRRGRGACFRVTLPVIAEVEAAE
jgi:hypothetical protein